MKGDVIRGFNRTFSSSITSSEDKAIRGLLHDQKIIFIPADKEYGIVVMDNNKCVHHEMISSASYDEVKENRSKQITNKIKKLVNNIHKKGSITSDLRHFLLPTEISLGNLQANPNIHKKTIHLKR